jgi:hypothetical protein
MDNKKKDLLQSPTIDELYPHLTLEELEEAEKNLMDYLEIVLRIYQRISSKDDAFDTSKDKY